ncbi:hypothetical protein [Corticibacter populi]|nr:hypothetical protein [Corticibacter populi]
MDKDLELVRAWCAYWIAGASHDSAYWALTDLLGPQTSERLARQGLL